MTRTFQWRCRAAQGIGEENWYEGQAAARYCPGDGQRRKVAWKAPKGCPVGRAKENRMKFGIFIRAFIL
jgi:hypothetical protein